VRSLKNCVFYLAIAWVASVGCLDTAYAQGNTLQATPNTLTFNSQPGNPPPPQSLMITSAGSINVAVTTSVDWLQVTPRSGATPLNLTVSIGPTAPTSGSNGGFITISPTSSSSGASPISVFVTLNTNTTASSPFSAVPGGLTFNFQAGSTFPTTQNVNISTSDPSVMNFTANAHPNDNGNWLSVAPNFGTVLPATLQVTVNPAALAIGPSQFSGVITVGAPGVPSLNIPVTVNINGTPTLTADPTKLSFAFQPGTSAPAAQTLNINSSSGASVSFTAFPNNGGSCGNNWLVLSQQTGVTPAALSVQINTTGLTLGTCNGEIDIFGSGAATPSLVVPVTLLVSANPLLQVPTTGPAFAFQLNSNVTPAAQSVMITSSGTPLSFTIAAAPTNGGPNFLSVTPATGTTPQQVTFTVNAATLPSLAPGTYTETVTVTSAGAANSPQTFPVTLTVTNNPLLVSNLTALNFNFQIGHSAPQSQIITLSSNSSPLNFTVASDSGNCANFLSAAPVSGTTLAPQNQVVVSVNTAGLSAATTCSGTLTITVPGSASPALVIPVKLNVSTTPLLNVSQGAISASSVVGSPTISTQTISVTSTDATTPLFFTATGTTNPAGLTWLSVTPNSGTTPSNLQVTINPANLAIGTYTGTITVTPQSGPAQTIPVTLTVTNAAVTPSATSLTFNQPFGGAAPPSQTITLTGVPANTTVGATVTLLNGTGWLTATPGPNGTVVVAADGSKLAQGTYSGIVTIIVPGAANSPLQIGVTLVVGSAQTLAVNPTSVSLTLPAGSTTLPAAQTIQVTSTGGNVPFTASFAPAAGGANFLVVTPTSGTTPASLSLTLNAAVVSTLAVGSYTGTITVASVSIPGGSQLIPVTLTVTAPSTPGLGAVVNSASFQPGSVSPGELVTIFGTNLGPTSPVGLQLLPSGAVSTNIGNTTVTFDGVPAPLTFVSATQINAIVPYEVAGHVTTNVVVTHSGSPSTAPLVLRVADTAPAIFSLTQTGNGQGAIINQNQTVNTPGNPAVKGTVISIYATGEGQLVPGVATGSVTPASLPVPRPIATPTVTIGGQPAQIQFFGEAPGLVSGVLQINAVVPTNIGSGPQTIVLNMGSGSNASQTITVSVQ
jgi:uncharacterized protein (TIGR03437 family)